MTVERLPGLLAARSALRVPRRLTLAAGGAVAFAVLARLVVSGRLTGVDQYAVRHLMPGLYPYFAHGVLGSTVPFTSPGNPHRIVNRVADWVTAPADVGDATILFAGVALGAAALRRRSPAATACWLGAYALGNVVELVGKTALERPPLYTTPEWGSAQLWKFDASFPSGHATRALLLAALVAATVPRLRAPAAVWACAVLVLLELAGTHTPTDVVGGILVAAALVLCCREAEARLHHRSAPA